MGDHEFDFVAFPPSRGSREVVQTLMHSSAIGGGA